MKRKRKVKNIILSTLVLVMIMGITSQAGIVITQNEKLINVGTSGSAWKNEAKGNRTNSSITDSLYSGIKRKSDSSYRYGNPVGGNLVYLTAYSPTLADAVSNIQGRGMVQ